MRIAVARDAGDAPFQAGLRRHAATVEECAVRVERMPAMTQVYGFCFRISSAGGGGGGLHCSRDFAGRIFTMFETKIKQAEGMM